MPRRINLLCDRALLGAYAQRQARASTRAIVDKAGARGVRQVGRRTAPIARASAAAPGSASSSPPAWRWRRWSASPSTAAGARSGGRRPRSPRGGPASASAAASPARPGRAAERRRPRRAPRRRAAGASAARPAAMSPARPTVAADAGGASRRERGRAAARALVGRTARRGRRQRRRRCRPRPCTGRSTPSASRAAPGRRFGGDEKTAWRELAAAVGVDAGSGDPCAGGGAPAGALLKFGATPADGEEPGRPGLVWLRDDAGRTRPPCSSASTRHRDAAAAGDADARRADRRARQGLARRLRHAWRLPPGYASVVAEGASGPLVDRLATQIASFAGEPAPAPGQTMDAELLAKVSKFQAAHGLTADGKAGPTTFMQLNRATGIDEPRLAVDAPPDRRHAAAMSYILDALRRADAERERGAVPSLHSQQHAFTEDDAAPRPAALAGLGGRRARARGARGCSPGFSSAEPRRRRARPSKGRRRRCRPACRLQPAPPTAAVPAVPPEVSAAPPPRQRRLRGAASRGTAARGRGGRRLRDPRPPTTAAARQRRRRRSEPARRRPRRRRAAGPTRALRQAELPEEIRRDLPKLVIGGSSYSGDAASRMVMINGQVFHEGDRLAPDLVLERIRHKSAVLAFKGWRYEVLF